MLIGIIKLMQQSLLETVYFFVTTQNLARQRSHVLVVAFNFGLHDSIKQCECIYMH